MLFADGFFGLVLLGLWFFCIMDVIVTDSGVVRNLPKPVWLLLVLLIPDVGSLAWLIGGHPWASSTASHGLPSKGNHGRVSTGRRAPAPSQARNPDDDEEFLARLRARAEDQRRRGREQDTGPDPVG